MASKDGFLLYHDGVLMLVLGPRPKLKKIAGRDEEVIFTLLTVKEDAEDVGHVARAGGKIWCWHPLSVRHRDFSSWADWVTAVNNLDQHLGMNYTVYLHCAAGIHRTGCVTYLLFRKHGYSPGNARAAVFNLRPIIEDQINSKFDDIEELMNRNGGF